MQFDDHVKAPYLAEGASGAKETGECENPLILPRDGERGWRGEETLLCRKKDTGSVRRYCWGQMGGGRGRAGG